MSLMAKNFPIKDVSLLSQMEASSRQNYRPIYSVHRWWARRLGVIFRTIAISLFAKTENPTDILNLSDRGKYSPMFNKRSSSSKKKSCSYPRSLYYLIGAPSDIINEVRKENEHLYQLTIDTTRVLSRSVILDPFCGGGTTLVEVNRLGGHVLGYDINPIAWWTTRVELIPCSSKDIEEGFNVLKSVIAEKLLDLYKTRCSRCHSLADAMYIFWVRWVHCPSCSEEIYLFKYNWLAKPSKTYLGTVTCPNPSCFHVFSLRKPRNEESELVNCPSCHLQFNPSVGPYRRGKYYCRSCGYVGHLKQDLSSGKVKEYLRMHAVEFYCPTCNYRGYHEILREDQNRYLEAENLFEKQKNLLLYPRQEIPRGTINDSLLASGITHYHELFSKRQLIGLSWLLEAIMNLEDVSESVQDLLLSAFSSSLEYHNLLCQYNYSYRKITNLFNHHVYTKTPIPVENNIWGAKYGAGTFRSFIRKIIKAKKYAENPFERLPQNKTPFFSGKIGARMSPSPQNFFQEVRRYHQVTERGRDNWRHHPTSLPLAYLSCSSSLQLGAIPTGSIDAIITDPPYYDNIQYSELSNFFYVWSREALKTKYNWFQHPNVSNDEEIVSSNHAGKDYLRFQRLLTNVWKECHRVLKHDGRLVFTYHHSDLLGWSTLLFSLVDANFVIEGVFPVVAEISYNPHVKKESSITHDIIFLCKKRTGNSPTITIEQLYYAWKEAYHEVRDRLSRDQLKDSDDFVVRMGVFLKVLSRDGINLLSKCSNINQKYDFVLQLAREFT